MTLEFHDPVLEAADRAIERREKQRPRRMYLGMSSGGRCPRQQFYNWTWAGQRELHAVSLKRIADGFAGEDIVAARLQAAGNVVLLTRAPETGAQFGVSDAGGQVAGHLDGKAFKHPAAPTKEHVWECKVTNDRSLAKFRKIKEECGEKAALREWNFEYWVQAQLYMLHTELDRHWLVVASAGCRDWDSCRTSLDRDQAEYFGERMARMVDHIEELPERISENPNHFACRWCDFVGICHEGGLVERNCRTCRWSKPVAGPNWYCEQHKKNLTAEEQMAGCDRQRYRSNYIPGEELCVTGLAVTYKLRNGEVWSDEGDANE